MIIHLEKLDIPEVSIYAARKENLLKRIYEPQPGLFIVETANVILRALMAGYEVHSLLINEKYICTDESGNETSRDETVAEILHRAGQAPVYSSSLEEIDALTGFKQAHGILCAMKRRPLPALSDILQNAKRIAVLENVENPTNVGAIFRSAAGLGIDAAVLTFRTSDPLYRRASRVSMGGVFNIPWTFVGNKYGGWPGEGIRQLKEAGFKLVSMALSDRAVFLDHPDLKQEEKIAILFGNEQEGLLEETLNQSDYIAMIPMMEGVDSLNVAAASAVAFWELRKKR